VAGSGCEGEQLGSMDGNLGKIVGSRFLSVWRFTVDILMEEV